MSNRLSSRSREFAVPDFGRSTAIETRGFRRFQKRIAGQRHSGIREINARRECGISETARQFGLRQPY